MNKPTTKPETQTKTTDKDGQSQSDNLPFGQGPLDDIDRSVAARDAYMDGMRQVWNGTPR